MDPLRPSLIFTVESILCGKPQVFQCWPCENGENSENAIPEIISPSKIYYCEKCSEIFSSVNDKEKHESNRLCGHLSQENSLTASDSESIFDQR